jgi:hypothetical protein
MDISKLLKNKLLIIVFFSFFISSNIGQLVKSQDLKNTSFILSFFLAIITLSIGYRILRKSDK